MRYRVYSGPRGSAELAPLEKEKMLFKEFEHLDAALAPGASAPTDGDPQA